jgi:glycosyltransferase involved in cell wall biosynthesis
MQAAYPRVMLISTSSGSTGGGEYYLANLATALLHTGVDCRVLINCDASMDYFYTRFSSQIPIDRREYTNTYARPARAFSAWFDRRSCQHWVSRIIEFAPDVVHLNQQTLEDGLDVIKATRILGIPLICTTHVPHSSRSLGARFGWLRDIFVERILAHGQQHHICVSPASSKTLGLRLPAHKVKGRIHTVFNGVQLDQRSTDADLIESVKKYCAGKFVLGAVGRLEAQKNPLFLVDVLASIQHPEVCLLWVGEGSLRQTMLDYAKKMGVSDKVICTGWVKNPAAYFPYMSVFCMPSRYEGLPLALLEAMMAGLSVVAAKVDGIADVIHTGRGGELIEDNRPSSWVTALKDLLEHDQQRRDQGNYNAQLACRQFSVDAMADATLRLYQDMLRSAKQDPYTSLQTKPAPHASTK